MTDFSELRRLASEAKAELARITTHGPPTWYTEEDFDSARYVDTFSAYLASCSPDAILTLCDAAEQGAEDTKRLAPCARCGKEERDHYGKRNRYGARAHAFCYDYTLDTPGVSDADLWAEYTTAPQRAATHSEPAANG